MWLRALTGTSALGLYGWRVHDPKGSYAAFFDASDWLTSFVIGAEGIWWYVRSFINLILVDQVDGFLLGMAFMALISIVFWPFRVGGAWVAGKAGAVLRKTRSPAPPERSEPVIWP